jgi:hypothetical protein
VGVGKVIATQDGGRHPRSDHPSGRHAVRGAHHPGLVQRLALQRRPRLDRPRRADVPRAGPASGAGRDGRQTNDSIAVLETKLQVTEAEIRAIEDQQLRAAVITPLDEPRSVISTFVDALGSALTDIWQRRRVGIVLAVVVLVGLGIAGPLVGDWWGALMGSAPMAGLVAAGTWVWSRGAKFWANARKAAATIKAEADRIIERDAARKVELEKQRDTLRDRVEKLKSNLADQTLEGQFEVLLQQLGDEKRFEAYRGLAGRVHRDLENYAKLLKRMLSELARTPPDLTARPAVGPTGRRPPQRIVLFIDDLDRCRSDRVVEVLQAINLLTTTGLFVVIAAIEPGWVMKSLSSQHAQQITGTGGRDARALQFLDKLFPLALAVRPMGARAPGFLRELLGTAEPSGQGEPGRGSADDSDAPDTDPGRNSAVTSDSSSGAPPSAVSDTAVQAATSQAGQMQAVRSAEVVAQAVRAARLSQAEIDFLPELTPLLAGPRAAKRFANLYRLLHASLPPDDRRRFRADREAFKPTAALLAAVVGAPDQAEQLLTLFDATTRTAPVTVDELLASRCGLPIVGTLAGLVQTLDLPRDPDSWAPAAHRVARYSVATYSTFSARRSAVPSVG